MTLPVLASTVAPVMTDPVRMLLGGLNKILGSVTQRVVCMLLLPLVKETIQKKGELSRHNKTLDFYQCSVLVPFIFAGRRPSTSIKTAYAGLSEPLTGNQEMIQAFHCCVIVHST